MEVEVEVYYYELLIVLVGWKIRREFDKLDGYFNGVTTGIIPTTPVSFITVPTIYRAKKYFSLFTITYM